MSFAGTAIRTAVSPTGLSVLARGRVFLYLLLIFLSGQVGELCSQTTSETTRAAGNQHVEIGIFLNKLEGVSLQDNSVEVDFYLWFRWRNPALKPHETFSLINGEIDSVSELYTKPLTEGFYGSCRVQATLHAQWDVADFPLDNHQIVIQIESSQLDSGKQVFIPDRDNSRINPSAKAGGWVLLPGEIVVDEHSYNTNYGDPSLSDMSRSLFSRFTYKIQLRRTGISLFIKLFSGLFIAAAIAFLCFLIPPGEVDPRFGLPVGAMFAAIASEFVVVSTLPDTPGLTMADELHILTFCFIFVCLIESTLALALWNRGRKDEVRRLDRTCAIVIPLLFLVSWLALIQWRCEVGILGWRNRIPSQSLESE